MRQALEMALDWIKKQPEETPDSKYDVDTRYVVIREIEAALAQPEQEPVAYLVLFEGAGKLLEFKKGNYIHGAKVEHIPLYTTPPQRKPLTDEEIKELYGDDDNFRMTKKYVIAFARAIEAAHGIKE